MEFWANLSSGTQGLAVSYGLFSIFLVMLLKEAGLPIPVPSDLIMIVAGAQVAIGTYGLIELLVAVEVALAIGASVQFLLVRGLGRRLLYGPGRFIGLTPARLNRSAALVRRRGALAVFLGLNVPGARAGVIIAAGLAGLNYRTVAPAIIAGSTLFYGWHIALGFAVGLSAESIIEELSLPLALAGLGLALLGLIGWLLLRGRRKGDATPERAAVDRLRSWTEAACPGCLATATFRQLRSQAPSAQKT